MLRIKNNQISNSNTTDINRKRKVLSEITNLDDNKQDEPIIVSPIYKNEIEKEIAKSIGNYFTADSTKKLFGTKDNETVYDCLTRRIDVFDDIITLDDNTHTLLSTTDTASVEDTHPLIQTVS